MKKSIRDSFVGLRELRENLPSYIKKIDKGEAFIVVKRSRPVFKIGPIADGEDWEPVIDFTKIKKGGVDIDDILTRL